MPCDSLFCCLHVSGDDGTRHLSCDAGRTADKALRVLLYDFVTDTRLVIVFSLDMSCRDDLHQVLVAIVVLGQQNKVIIASVILVLELVIIVSGHIYLTSDDRLDLRILFRHFQELLHSVHVTMVGDSKCGHSKLFCALEKACNRGLTVKDRILCMDMKMDE